MTNVTDSGTNAIPLVDTREQLEADIKKAVTYITSTAMWPPSANKKTEHVKTTFDEITEWLDRQDAITQRECIDRWDDKALALYADAETARKALAEECEEWERICDKVKAERDELQAKVDELTEELEEARKRHMENEDQLAEENDALIAKVDELTEERDCYKRYVERWQKLYEGIGETHMRLPVDADGVPCRIGDKMEWTNPRNGEKERFVCAGYTTEYSTWTPDNITLMATNDECAEFYCDQCRHVQPDTVESLLEEFHGKLWSDDEEQMALLDEYAERIRKAVER